ncbi:3-hydroxyisobutyrate dehydrogenase [Prosthecobacter fusiformis]|uniref:3-hydroxyisobutyrate dehydrogenase n=1 Tax=Prosthecobacter fusiformis TaxID=48464 RepID=A0A4R7SR41_9BACT|nr:NAD(P)-dependent oxidoreductase [Prosthecobacter fusiformis]TDU81089.1 3-hydroxyisobutyrate dehydrogenase [Prosthecobacter fusiformis]
MSKTIAFVGVGRMGANMARRLKDCGYSITAVYDSHRPIATALADELGCSAPEKLADVAAAADIIFTVVTNDESMRSIFFGPGDNLLKEPTGKTFINCATVSPGIHREVYEAAKNAGAHSLEASMASSISHAREGKLYLMMAGDESVYNDVLPVLEQMSVNRRFIGGPGRAAEVKALVNMVMNINTAGLAEGLGLAAALGHDLDMVREVFSQTGANSRVLETDSADMVAREHDCWFSAEHAAKDSGIAGSMAEGVGLNLPLNLATIAQYKKMVSLGLGGLDKSGIAELTFKGRHA